MWFCIFQHMNAYELRISDWSSDVCSSDLPGVAFGQPPRRGQIPEVNAALAVGGDQGDAVGEEDDIGRAAGMPGHRRDPIARLRVPENHQPVARGGGELAAVRV